MKITHFPRKIRENPKTPRKSEKSEKSGKFREIPGIFGFPYFSMGLPYKINGIV